MYKNSTRNFLPFLVIFQFEVETHPDVQCPYDHVSISAGSNSGRLCGRVPPKNITSTSNSMTIRFVTDATYNMQGFLARFGTEGEDLIYNLTNCLCSFIDLLGNTERCDLRKVILSLLSTLFS